ncbi:MAG: AMP-binding protein [Proteobacteria bacterium]|nr:AMP-binding protein [Pseudomonadota bacterium]
MLDSTFPPRFADALAQADGPARWTALRALLRPSDPFDLHRALFTAAWADHDTAEFGPAPAWSPTDEELTASRMGPLLAEGSFAELHRRSVAEPERWWRYVLDELQITFRTPPDRMLDADGGAEAAAWLPGAKLNIAESCFAGRDPDEAAVIVQGPGGPLTTITRGQLHRRASRVARALHAQGFLPGDAIAGCMPMTASSVEIYLGVVLAGCVFVSIADSFSADEIATRLRISGARAIVTQDVIVRGARSLPLFDRVVAAQAPAAIVLSGTGGPLSVTLRDGDCTWEDFQALGSDELVEPVIVGPDATTNILFSSGTTGEPKAIPWTQVTPIKAAGDAIAHQDVRPGDVVAWPTNLGWMMGPWLIYAALLNGASIALFEGAPHGPDFCRFVRDARVTMLGVVPSLVRAWRTDGATDGVDWSSVRCFSSTGEASGFDDYLWLMSRVPNYRPVVEYCGGTEIGGGYICGSVAQPQAPATFSTPAFGCDFAVLDDTGAPTTLGELALIAPMLGSSSRLLNRDHHTVYFAGMPPGPSGQTLRRHGDQMERLPGGFLRAHGRADDTMNLGGIKVSSAEIERVVAGLDGITECAAIAVAPPGGGPSELVLCVVGGGLDPDDLRGSAQQAIRSGLNPLFKVARVRLIEQLPRTASGKVMRRILRRAEETP